MKGINRFSALNLARSFGVIVAFSMVSAPVMAGYDIGAPATGMFGKIGSFMQQVIDFIDGPTALFVTVISIAFAAFLWMVAPKGGAAGWAVRVAIAAIIVLNISTWVVALKNGG